MPSQSRPVSPQCSACTLSNSLRLRLLLRLPPAPRMAAGPRFLLPKGSSWPRCCLLDPPPSGGPVDRCHCRYSPCTWAPSWWS
eukprot:scaffold5874_cov140-Isochrysis_galbana.AAC.4